MHLTTLLGALAVTAQVVQGQTVAIPNPGSAWTRVFGDDFIGSARALPSSQWIIRTGTSYPGGPANWGTGEIQTYTSSTSNLALTGSGTLRINAIKGKDGKWTSARIETSKQDFAAPAKGRLRIEARIKQPNISATYAQGYWGAFWTLGQGIRSNTWSWPSVGEIDIMEAVNARGNSVSGIHCGTNPGGVCNEPSGLGTTSTCPTTSCTGNWHVYRVEVDRRATVETLTFSIDGVTTQTLRSSTVGAATWNQAINGGHFIILNLAMGGGFPDGVAGTTTPTSRTLSGAGMEIDYVAAWTART